MYKLSCVVAFSLEQKRFRAAEGNDKSNTVKIAQFISLFVPLLEIPAKTMSADGHERKKTNLGFLFCKHTRKLALSNMLQNNLLQLQKVLASDSVLLRVLGQQDHDDSYPNNCFQF